MHGIWLIAYMCDTCSIPFSGTRNSFPCTKSWLDAIWDHNWTFKHHLIAISRSFKVHPYMLDMIHMARPALNLFIWLLDYLRVSKYDSLQYGTIADNILTTTMSFQGHAKVIHFISNMHGIWLVAYMCDTCSIPFSWTRNSFPCTKSWLNAIWDHNWT